MVWLTSINEQLINAPTIMVSTIEFVFLILSVSCVGFKGLARQIIILLHITRILEKISQLQKGGVATTEIYTASAARYAAELRASGPHGQAKSCEHR